MRSKGQVKLEELQPSSQFVWPQPQDEFPLLSHNSYQRDVGKVLMRRRGSLPMWSLLIDAAASICLFVL